MYLYISFYVFGVISVCQIYFWAVPTISLTISDFLLSCKSISYSDIILQNDTRNSVDRSINWMWRCNYVRLLNEAISGIAKLFKPFNKFVVVVVVVVVVDKTCSLLLESLSRLSAPTIIWPFLNCLPSTGGLQPVLQQSINCPSISTTLRRQTWFRKKIDIWSYVDIFG